MQPTSTAPLSDLFRTRTADEHEAAEASPFMTALLAGDLSLAAYADLLVQLRPVYAALERGAEHLATSELAPLLAPGLARSTRLEQDLTALADHGVATDHEVTDAAVAYAARITAIAEDWPAGYLAHHWTRYLGDLAGGQAIRRVLRTAYDLPADGGTAFFDFPDLPPAPHFRGAYRQAMDALPWSDREAAAAADEAANAFRHNRTVFAALDRRH